VVVRIAAGLALAPCAPVGAWWLVSMQMAYVALVLRSCWSTEETIEPRTVR
jgi:hypothetical protein